jgi:membrane protein
MGLVRFAVVTLWQVEMAQMAAALSYRTIFGLIPVLVVGLVFLGAFSTEAQMTQGVERLLDFTGISGIVIDTTTPDVRAAIDEVYAAQWAAAHAEGPLMRSPEALAPAMNEAVSSSPRLDDWITTLVANVRRIPFTTIGFVGLATLAYAAISMMVEIEKCFNHIYRAPEGRSWTRRITQYWTLLTLGTLFLFASFFVGEWLRDVASNLRELDEVVTGLGSRAITGVGFGITVLISTVLFLIVFTTVPNTRVAIGPALVGALVAAVLWETGKWGFTQYLRYSASYAQFYGSIALIPLFLLWVYVTWTVVLLGLSIAHAIQTHKVVRTHGLSALHWFMPDPESARRAALVDPAAILAVAASVAERFADKQPTRPSDVSARTGIDETVCTDMLERLAGSGVLHRVAKSTDDDATYVLSGPPATIRAEDVLDVGRSMAEGLDTDTTVSRRVIGELEKAKLGAVRGKTLADFLPPSAAAPVPIVNAELTALAPPPAPASTGGSGSIPLAPKPAV